MQNVILGFLGELTLPQMMVADERPAWLFLAETINNSEQPVRIISLCGFTNIA